MTRSQSNFLKNFHGELQGPEFRPCLVPRLGNGTDTLPRKPKGPEDPGQRTSNWTRFKSAGTQPLRQALAQSEGSQAPEGTSASNTGTTPRQMNAGREHRPKGITSLTLRDAARFSAERNRSRLILAAWA